MDHPLLGQVVSATMTTRGSFGVIVAKSADRKRYFWHSSDCVDLPNRGDVVGFTPGEPRRSGELPRASNVRVVATLAK
jgi:hypothetical protein